MSTVLVKTLLILVRAVFFCWSWSWILILKLKRRGSTLVNKFSARTFSSRYKWIRIMIFQNLFSDVWTEMLKSGIKNPVNTSICKHCQKFSLLLHLQIYLHISYWIEVCTNLYHNRFISTEVNLTLAFVISHSISLSWCFVLNLLRMILYFSTLSSYISVKWWCKLAKNNDLL